MSNKYICIECNEAIDNDSLIFCGVCGSPLHEWCIVPDELNISSLCSSCYEKMSQEIEEEAKELQEYIERIQEEYEDEDCMEDYEDKEDDGYDDYEKDDYNKWLEEIGEEDSDTLREWYELDDKDRAEWLRNHPDPF